MNLNKEKYGIRDTYSLYKENSSNPVTINLYLEIVQLFLKYLISLTFQGEEVKLPARMGIIVIQGKKSKARISENTIKGLAPNWKETKKLWSVCDECKQNKQLVFHFNEHSMGIRYKFFWSKKSILVENKTLYALQLTRTNKRYIKSLIEKGKEYIVKV